MIKSKIEKILITTLLLLFLWMNYFAFHFIAMGTSSSSQIQIPTDSKSGLVIQPNLLTKDALSQMLLDERYQPLIQILKKNILSSEDRKEWMKTGIDFSAPILLFNEDGNGESYDLMFTLTSKREFLSFLKQQGLNGFITRYYGVIYFRERPIVQSLKRWNFPSKSAIHWFDQENHQANIQLKKDTLLFSGTIASHQKMLDYLPVSKHFLFVSTFPDSLSKNLKIPIEYRQFVKNIKAIAMDFDGIEFRSGGMFPLVNIVFQTDGNFHPLHLMDSIPNLTYQKIDEKNYHLSLSNHPFLLKKLDDDEWFIGTDEKLVEPNRQKIVFALKGNPSDLMKIRGNSILGLGMNFIPGFQPTKEFLSKMETCAIVVNKTQTHAQISGRIVMKASRNLILESILLGLKLND